MSSSRGEATAQEFVARINAHDPHGIMVLCTADHAFIDSLGRQVSGHANLERAWRDYFSLFPDYRIDVEAMASAGELVLLSGWASATVGGSQGPVGSSWRIPAAWRAVVTEGRVARWQVYADNKPVYEALDHEGQPGLEDEWTSS